MKQSRRDLILDAAERIVEKETIMNLSFDRIAGFSKISKGGILYHFPAKEDLLRGMVSRAIETFDSTVSVLMKQRRLNFREAYILASFNTKWARMAKTLLPVVMSDMSLMGLLKEAYKKWNGLLGEQSSKAAAMKVRLMLDGLLYNQILGLPLPPRNDLEQLFKR
ncbi:MAG: TetR/AcrR family transcriptional regulator [Deltaproteobacteria bacterium]|nr:TetR/AcrR family transcriptional regulator [Deltaproteobacteria bacterium]